MRKQMLGLGIVKTTLSVLLLVIVALVAFFEGRKAYLDHQVRELCAKDGGVKVFERVMLAPDRFNNLRNKLGVFQIPIRPDARPTDEYYSEVDIHYYRMGNPEMSRRQYRIVRRSDGKVLGELVIYGRGGGDFPSPLHGSSFNCPVAGLLPNLENSIFFKIE